MRPIVLAVLLLSLAWPLRGQFDHLYGALIPGAFAAAFLALAGPSARWRVGFGQALLLGAAGFSIGGHIGYGAVVRHLHQALTLAHALPALLKFGDVGAFGGLTVAFARQVAVEQKCHPTVSVSPLAGMAGWIGFAVAIPLIDGHDVLSSWIHERSILSRACAGFIQLLSGLLALGAGVWLATFWKRVQTNDQALSRLLRLTTVAVAWLLSVLAIAKETVPLGWLRWEPAFTLFLACCVLLSAMLLPRAPRLRSFPKGRTSIVWRRCILRKDA